MPDNSVDLTEVEKFLQRARKLIDATPLPPERRRNQHNGFSAQCEKCNWWYSYNDIDEHREQCRWECGLCGDRFNVHQTYITHCSRCAAKPR